jgi:hypothetical protein
MATRTCAHCGAPIPDTMRRGTRFCGLACRVSARIKTRMSASLAEAPLNRTEAGLLIDAGVPWATYVGDEYRAKKGQMALRRLAALGLIRVGRLVGSYGKTVIERTEAGSALLAHRHNELGAIAERGNGRPVTDIGLGTWLVFWRNGGFTTGTAEQRHPLPSRPAKNRRPADTISHRASQRGQRSLLS